MKSTVVNNLKKLGLIAPIALAAGVVASPAFSAGFSAIDQPFARDFFVGSAVNTFAIALQDLGFSDVGFAGLSVNGLFVGKNLINQNGLIAGVVAEFSRSNAIVSKIDGEWVITATKPVGKSVDLGAYVAYQSKPNDKTAFKVGFLGDYARDISHSAPVVESLTPAVTPHIVSGKIDESYTVELTHIAGEKLFLTQFGQAYAKKDLHVEDPGIAFSAEGGLKLGIDIGSFSPFLSASVVKSFAGHDPDKFLSFFGGGFSWKGGEHAALKFDLAKNVGDLNCFTAGIGLDLLF